MSKRRLAYNNNIFFVDEIDFEPAEHRQLNEDIEKSINARRSAFLMFMDEIAWPLLMEKLKIHSNCLFETDIKYLMYSSFYHQQKGVAT